EDGLRDFHVTGVQTCALPIWSAAKYRARVILRLEIRNDLAEPDAGRPVDRDAERAVRVVMKHEDDRLGPARIADLRCRDEQRALGRKSVGQGRRDDREPEPEP